MMDESLYNNSPRNRPAPASSDASRGGGQGIVLLVTLVLLVVLSTLGYTLSTRLSAQRHRDQYIIDYQTARYGCNSAVKYALATLQDIQPQLINRPNEPDFSDLFAFSNDEYQQLLAQITPESSPAGMDKGESFNDTNDIGDANDINDVNNINDINDISSHRDSLRSATDSNDLISPTIRGPYGPPWPLITEPTEFEVGSATVRIKIEDENAKYPLGWALLEDKDVQREAEAGFETFCEWVGFDSAKQYPGQSNSLKSELEQISEIKMFKLDFKPITRVVSTATDTTTRETTRRGRRVPVRRRRPTRKTIPVSTQIKEQTTHFAKLFHCSLINTEALAKPYIQGREESALKYMGLWGSRRVNINTAPRHVLEAAFAFGGDAKEIAEAIIRRRRIQPFKDIEGLRQSLFRYSDSIRKCEKYITTTSTFFTIKATAVSGVAETSSVIAVTKTGKTLKQIAVISD